MDKITEYDYSKEFKAECLQSIITLKKFCRDRNIPFFMTFAVKSDKKSTSYTTIKQLPPECNAVLADDMVRRIVLAERGFDLAINNMDSFDMNEIPPNILHCDDDDS